MKPYYEDEHSVIYCGDCRDVLPFLKADALITDPPYGVNFTGKKTKDTNNQGQRSYIDTNTYFTEVVLPAVVLALSRTTRGAIFSGIKHLLDYPIPRDIGGIIHPSGSGMSPWGFGCYLPILYYGDSPYQASGQGARPTATSISHPGMHVTGERNAHPCQKPLSFMTWLVNIASLPGELVLDPFLGSGTTAVACRLLQRRCIGIEIDKTYCDIAIDRFRQEVLPFAPPAPLLQQGTLL